MNNRQVVASGPVGDVVGDAPSVHIDVSAVEAAEAVLGGLAGVRSIGRDGGPHQLVVAVGATPRAEVVAELVRAGVGVDRVMPRRRLEDAFLALIGPDNR